MCRRPGMVLLEVIIALALLAIAGTTLVLLSSASLSTVHRSQARDSVSAAADELMSSISLWTIADLDRHLGARRQGPWIAYIEREQLELYRVVVLDTASRSVILSTALYRESER